MQMNPSKSFPAQAGFPMFGLEMWFFKKDKNYLLKIFNRWVLWHEHHNKSCYTNN